MGPTVTEIGGTLGGGEIFKQRIEFMPSKAIDMGMKDLNQAEHG